MRINDCQRTSEVRTSARADADRVAVGGRCGRHLPAGLGDTVLANEVTLSVPCELAAWRDIQRFKGRSLSAALRSAPGQPRTGSWDHGQHDRIRF
jgi:hypothetical protein